DAGRRVVHEGFGPRPVASFAPVAREIITRFVEQLPETGRFDLVESFANKMTLAVVIKVVGYDDGDFSDVREWVALTTALLFGRNLDYERQGGYGRGPRARVTH